jgi:alkanesulfonate monooxygenase SsuD/methylene tetrahydromethanopterin reductase-like flavin-dependent oxidoreductase (luciferase family)
MQFWTGGMGVFKLRALPMALADSLEQWVADAAAAEALGFDGYGAPEHHFMYDGFMPIPLQALAAAAAATSRIRLVTGAMLLPLYDPLQAAELAATVDVLSGGRVTLGLGMGYRPYEFDGLGTAKATRGARLIEAMEILRRATRDDRFSHCGQHYRCEDVAISPRPVQRPIPLWLCGGTTLRGARRAGQSGFDYWLANTPYEQAAELVAEYRAAARAAGHDPDGLRVATFKDVCIGETVAEAVDLRRQLLQIFYDEHILGYGYLVDEDGNHLYNLPVDHALYRRFIDSIFCGTVEMVIEELKRYERLGMAAVFLPTPQRELVARRIFPEFR